MNAEVKDSETALIPALLAHVATFLQTDCPKAGHQALALLGRIVREQRFDPVFREPGEHLRNVVEHRLSEFAQRDHGGDTPARA